VLRYLRQRLPQACVAFAAVSVDSLGRLLLVCVCVVVVVQHKEFDLLSLTVAQGKKYERPLIVRHRLVCLVSLAFEEKDWSEEGSQRCCQR
jgi:hypothetical protein